MADFDGQQPGARGEPKRIGTSLDEVLRRLGAPPAKSIDRLFSGWPALIGERVAAHAKPVSVDQGRLVVAVDSPAWATELKYQQAKLLKKLAAELGDDVVTRIDIRVERPTRPRRDG